MSDIEPDEPLSDPAMQVVIGWMRQQEGGRRSKSVSPLVPELVRYMCGALPPGEAVAVEDRLIDTGKALKLLREVRTELLRLEAMPWHEVAAAAVGDDQRAVVATAWLALTSEQMQAAERAPARWLADGWQSLRSQVEAGFDEALAAWNAFLAFGAQWGRELHAPGRFAPERGEGGGAEAVLPGVSAPVHVEAVIHPDDALQVTLQIEPQPNAAVSALNGRSVLLALRNGTEFWPLSIAPIHEGYVEWRIPGFGAATGMPSGEIPPEALQFTFSDVVVPPPAESPLRLLAEITDGSGRSTGRGLVPIIFLEEPRWSEGEFLARVELPAETRYWLNVGYRLHLDLAVSGGHWQHLGAWTLADGDGAPHTLQASCPGSLDVILPSVTLIRAQLRPPE
ncbi:MAG: hypothetical protein JWL77_2438 [Chthonomonadaceae bacterium]|nr:hypothetical protein [Chthonomonadaceae bacterium]